MPEPKPTLESINRIEQYYKEVWSNAWSQWKRDDDLYWQKYQVWDSALNRDSYHPAKSTEIIDHAVDNLMVFTARVHRWPTGDEQVQQERADRIERWMVALFEDCANFEPQLPFKTAGKYMTHYGLGCIDAPGLISMKEKPAGNRRIHWNPFRIRAPQPSQVLMNPLEKNPERALKISHMLSEDLSRLTENKSKQRGLQVDLHTAASNPYASIPVREYWSKDWHAVAGPSSLYYVEPNTWRIQPLKQAYSGFGMLPMNQTRVDPFYLAVGITRGAHEEIIAFAQAMSALHNNITEHGYPMRGTRGDPSEFAEARAGSDILQGERDDFWVEEVSSVPRHLFNYIGQVLSDIDAGTFSPSVSGRRQAGVSTVGQQAILSASAGKKFVALVRQLESLATLTASDILRMIDVMKKPVTIHGYTIGPEDIERDYSIRVSFELVDPVIQLQNRQIGASEVMQGLKSLETFWDADLKLEDSSGERIRLLEDKIRADPQVAAMLAAAVVQGMGLPGMPGMTEGGPAGAGQQGLVAPNGQALASTMGAPTANPPPPGSPMENMQAGEQMRQALTPEVLSPSRTGQARTGAMI